MTNILSRHRAVYNQILIYIKFTTIVLFIFSLAGCRQSQNNSKEDEQIMKQGAILFSKYGCMICHSINGSELYGPSLNDIFMKKVNVIRNDTELTVVVDREYLKKAIKDPRYEKVLEYNNKDMPLTFLTDEEIDILVEYIVALSKTEHDSSKLE